jgi:hypothetical protein
LVVDSGVCICKIGVVGRRYQHASVWDMARRMLVSNARTISVQACQRQWIDKKSGTLRLTSVGEGTLMFPGTYKRPRKEASPIDPRLDALSDPNPPPKRPKKSRVAGTKYYTCLPGRPGGDNPNPDSDSNRSDDSVAGTSNNSFSHGGGSDEEPDPVFRRGVDVQADADIPVDGGEAEVIARRIPHIQPSLRLAYIPFKIFAGDGSYLGYILYNENSQSLDAHCARHGTRVCKADRTVVGHDGVGRMTPSRSAAGRPLGFLIAWLCLSYVSDAGQDGLLIHRSGKKCTPAVFNCLKRGDSAERLSARAYAQTTPHLALLLTKERPPRPNEPLEPLGPI